MNKIAEMVRKAIDERIANEHVQGVYRALERDPAVKGVGSNVDPGQRPGNIVPREQFSVRGGTAAPEESHIEKRVRKAPTQVTLISPVLIPSSTRRWRFSSPEGPISATMKDIRFLERLLSGQERVPMRADIEMDVLMETAEEKEAGVWVVKERAVLEVIHVRPPKAQGSLDLFSKPTIENDDTDQ